MRPCWWGMQPICDSPTLSHCLLTALRVRSRLHDKWTIYSMLTRDLPAEDYLPPVSSSVPDPLFSVVHPLQRSPVCPRKILQKWGVCIFRHPRVPENKDIPYDHPFSTIKVSTGRITNLLLPLCCTPVNKLILLSANALCESTSLTHTHLHLYAKA